MKTAHPAGLAVEVPGIFIKIILNGKKEIREINMEYMEKYRQDRKIY